MLLDGQGSDEYLAGYELFVWLYLKELAKRGQWKELASDLPAFETIRMAGLWEKSRRMVARFRRNGSNDLQTLYGKASVPRVPAELRITGSVNALVETRLGYTLSLAVAV